MADTIRRKNGRRQRSALPTKSLAGERIEAKGRDSMIQSRLRIYYGPDEEATETLDPPGPETVSVPLGEVFPALIDALENERTWVRDFEDDEITLPADLYQVILAYQHLQRPSA